MNKRLKNLIQSLILFPFIFPLLLVLAIKQNLIYPFIISFGFFIANFGIIWFHERKYKTNNPYKISQKNKLGKKILLGLLAGLHYLFFIGTYNHKKYNTQVFYPETLECFVGNISEAIILNLYVILGILIFEIVGYYYILFLIIPLITNIISLLFKKS